MTIQRVTIADLQQTIPVVDSAGKPSPLFLRYFNGAIRALKNSINSLVDVQNAADAANAAAAAANAAAAASTAAAASATAATAATALEQALINSYIVPDSVLTTTTTTITVAAHVRHYADGTTASVSGGTVAATASGDDDYVSYSDPTRVGGTVTYVASTTAPTQTGNIHVVGAITIPSSGSASGGQGPQRPGYVIP